MVKAHNLRIRLGKRVRQLRRDKDLSIEKLAELAKLSDKFIQAIETGRQAPSIDSIEKLARGLDVPVTDLLEGEPPRADAPTGLARGTELPGGVIAVSADRLTQLEAENALLKKMLAERVLEKDRDRTLAKEELDWVRTMMKAHAEKDPK
jgi:transcriptional regulator with XRE-family HTH domain